MNPPSKGKREEAPTHVFTSLAASVMGSFRTFVRYWIRLLAKPWYANLSANSTPTQKNKKTKQSSLKSRSNL